jgi:TolA-binding protein
MSLPQSPVIPETQPIEDPALKWELFWERNKSVIISVFALIAFGTVAAVAWMINTKLNNEAAQALLAEAKGEEGFQAVFQKYPKSPSAADALLLLAADRREAGKLEESTAAFRLFLDKFPANQLAGGALLGIGQNQDAAGDADAAMATYQQVISQYPASYAAPFAAYSEAEILLRTLKLEEARRSYNMVVSQFPQSPLARMAASQLARINTSSVALPEATVAEPATTAAPE